MCTASFLSCCFLLACGTPEMGGPERGSYTPEAAVEARLVSAAFAEGTAVAHALAMGSVDVAAARRSFVSSLLAVDLEGKPAFHLVFLTADAGVSSPFAYAAAHPSTLHAEGYFAMVGAREDQPEVGMSADSLTVLDDLSATLTALGGEAQLESVVAPTAGVLLLRDRQGAHWDVSTRTRLEPSTFEQRRREYLEAARRDDDGDRAAARTGWQARRSATSTPAEELAVQGHLDLDRALDAAGLRDEDVRANVRAPLEIERVGLLQESEENCKKSFFGRTKCDQVEEGRLTQPELTQAHYPHQPRGFRATRCILGGPRADDTDAYLGCGPAAVVGYVWTSWRNGVDYPALLGQSRNGLESYDNASTSAQYERFSRLVGQDLMNAMGTCSFGDDGSMTLPNGFVEGTNAWLAAQGSNQRMHIVRGGDRDGKADVLHTQMGLGERPVIAGFDLGFASSHWSPVARYRIVRERGLFAGGPKVYVQSIDYQDRWYELFGIKLVKALTWFEEAPEQRPRPSRGSER